MMKAAVRAILLFLLGVLACLLACEVVLRFLPVDRALPASPPGRPTLLVPNQPNSPYQYSARWFLHNAQAGRSNNYGQIAGANYVRGSRPLIVVGDSYIEALMNPEPVRLQTKLSALYDVPSYALGVSGLSASDYVVMAQQARDEFQPRAAVFSVIDGDFSESLLLQPRRYRLRFDAEGAAQLDYTPLDPSPFMQRLNQSIGEIALLNYVRHNLAFTPSALLPKTGSHATPPARERDVGESLRAVDWFLSELPRALNLPTRCISLVVDADRYGLYDPRLASKPKDPPAVRQHLLEAARAQGFNIIDMEPVFRTDYARDGLKFDHWPLDRHWNALGHATVAKAVQQSWARDGADASCGLVGK